MYNEHDRPSTTRIVVTVASIIGAVAVIVAIVAVAAGVFFVQPAAPTTGKPLATGSAQPPAKAIARTDTSSQPARTPPSTPTSAPAAVITTPVPATTAPATTKPPAQASGVVVIDPGHQGTLDTGMEANHPGASSPRKMKVAGGTSGVTTKVDESERNLQIALRLRKALEARGITVVMVRTTQNVDISNQQRAAIANNAHAALFIRLHCDSAPASVHGVLTLRPAKNWFGDPAMVTRSARAATLIHDATLKATGAFDRGITPRDDETGFNWCKGPTMLVEMGCMSNSAEDVRMGTAAYQDKLADGMANGIVQFLRS